MAIFQMILLTVLNSKQLFILCGLCQYLRL